MQELIAALEASLTAAETPTEKIAALVALAWPLRGVDPHRAFALCEEAAHLARAGGSPAELASGLNMAGACALVLSRCDDAAALLAECLPLCRREGSLGIEAHCLHSLGMLHYYRAEHSDAVEKTTTALHIREELADWEGVGASLNMLGNIQFALCDYGAALDWYTRSLEARERAGDQIGICMSLDNIGNIYGERGEWAEAVKYHQRGLDHAVRIGSPMLEVSLLCNLGGDYTDLGRYEESIEVSRRTIALGTALEKWQSVAFALTNLAHSLGKTGRQAEAIDTYARAIEVAGTVDDQKVVSHALYSIGDLLAGEGKLDDARRFLADGFVLAQSIGARRTAFLAAQRLSEVCKRLGDYAAALGHFEMYHRLEKEVFTEEAEDRAKSLVIKMEVAHHKREAETLSEINAALQAANARLESLATTDPLTGLPNHRALTAALDIHLAHARREGIPCGLLFLDVDYFKKFNDTYGHPVGDAVLAEFAACVKNCLRDGDTLGRWGGEEFLVLLPDTTLADALETGERVRSAVAGQIFTNGLRVTCSVGAAACPPQDAHRDALVSAADQALYAAKRLGRNQVRGMGDPAILALDGPLFPQALGHSHSVSREGVPRPAVSAE